MWPTQGWCGWRGKSGERDDAWIWKVSHFFMKTDCRLCSESVTHSRLLNHHIGNCISRTVLFTQSNGGEKQKPNKIMCSPIFSPSCAFKSDSLQPSGWLVQAFPSFPPLDLSRCRWETCEETTAQGEERKAERLAHKSEEAGSRHSALGDMIRAHHKSLLVRFKTK